MKKEKVNENKVNVKKQDKGKKYTVKSYIREFLLFVDKKLLKTIGVLFVIAILLIAVSFKFTVTDVLAQDCQGTCRDGVTILSSFSSQIQILFITAFAGIAPYLYAPIIGFIGYVLQEVSKLAYIIKGYGYLAGIGLGIIPLILNILVICIITALGIYICKNNTLGHKISNLKNMNMLEFKIKLYETAGKDEKAKELTKTRDEKIKKLEDKKEKINYLQILNVAIVVCIVQFISVLIQEIII